MKLKQIFKAILGKPRPSKYEYPDPVDDQYHVGTPAIDVVFTTDLTDRDTTGWPEYSPKPQEIAVEMKHLDGLIDGYSKRVIADREANEWAGSIPTTGDSPHDSFLAEWDKSKDRRKQNSREANDGKDKVTDQKRIIQSLSAIKQGTYYDIAIHSGLDPVAVARRMRELVDAGACNLLAIRMAAPGGRMCSVYRIKD